MPAGDAPTAAIVTIGDELLLGDRLDTNARWLARTLHDWGFEVQLHLSVGDQESRIVPALQSALAVGDVVVVTGGLGPTLDDRTREAVAALLGVRIEENIDVLQSLSIRARDRGLDSLAPTNRRLAGVPEGGVPVLNPKGSAPALLLELPRDRNPDARLLVLLPGVPAEMEALMAGEVGRAIRSRLPPEADPPVSRTIHTSGIPESRLAELVEARLPEASEVDVAYRPSILGVELRLGSAGGEEGEEHLDRAEALLASELAPFRFDDPHGDLAGAVGRELRTRGWTIGVAESCTGGLLATRLTDMPGSSGYFVGGVTAYSDGVKTELLGVTPGELEAKGAVSTEVALAMAEGIRTRLRSDVGVGITGIAGPGGAVPGKPVGTVCFGIKLPGHARTEDVRFPGGREEVRARAAQHALLLLFRELRREGGGDE